MKKNLMSFENIDREFKQIYVTDIRKTVVAFANTNGGKVYIGVGDDGSVLGIDDVDSIMQQAANSLKDNIAPDVMPFVDIKAISMDDKIIVEIDVQIGSNRPYYLKDKGLKPSGVYVRKGSSNQPLSDEGIRRMLLDNSGSSFEELRSMRQDLSFDFLKAKFDEKNLPLQIPQMRTLKLMGEDDLYTNLAYMLSDQCEYSIKVAIFQGSTKAIFRDRQEFSGSVLKQLYDVYDYLEKYNKLKATFEGLDRIDTRDYPEEALREVLLNCLIHRDYSYSGSTLINVYDDRMEFVTLGGLLQGMDLQTIMLGVSRSRNANLANVFYRLKLVESYGTGIEKIFTNYLGTDKKVEILPAYGAVKVVLPNVNESQKLYHAISEQLRASGKSFIVREDREPYGQRKVTTKPMKDNFIKPIIINEDEQVLNFVEEHGQITRKQVEELLGVKTTKAYNVLQGLCEAKKLVAIGMGKSRRYVEV